VGAKTPAVHRGSMRKNIIFKKWGPRTRPCGRECGGALSLFQGGRLDDTAVEERKGR